MDVDVGLDFAVHEEQTEAAVDLFDGHVNSLGSVVGSCQIVACHLAGEVQSLAQLSLNQSILVGGACSGLTLNPSGAAGNNRLAGDEVLELNALGLVACLDGSGHGEVEILFTCVFLVNVDNDDAVLGSADLDVLFGSVGGPYYVVGEVADGNNADDLEVTHCLAGLVLVHAEHVCSCIGDIILGLLCGSGRSYGILCCGGIVFGILVGSIFGFAAACKYDHDHGQKQGP